MEFDVVTGELKLGTEPGKPARGKKTKRWAGLGIAAAVLAVALFAAVKSGMFMGAGERILLAAANTVGYESPLTEDIRVLAKLFSGSYTADMKLKTQGAAVTAQYRCGPSEKQLAGSVDFIFLPAVDFLVSVTPSAVRIQLPDLDGRIFTYHYLEEKSGYLTKIFREEDLEKMDSALRALFPENDGSKVWPEMGKAFTQWYFSLDFERVGSREFEVYGERKKCAGYKLTGANAHLSRLLEKWEDISEESGNEWTEYAELGETLWYLRSVTDNIRNMDVTFYLCKNRLVCILAEADGEEFQILLESDGKGNLEAEYTVNGELLIQGSREIGDAGGKNEYHIVYEYHISYDNRNWVDMLLEYEAESGAIDFLREDNDSAWELQGSLNRQGESLALHIDKVERNGEDINMSAVLTVEEGASMEEMEGEEADLGSLPQSQWWWPD